MTNFLLNKGSLWAIGLALLLFTGCYKVEPNYLLVENRFTEIQIFEEGEAIPQNYSIINEFFIGAYNYDLSTLASGEDCGLTSVLNQARKEAKDIGGEAIKITALNAPTVNNPCYTIKGFILTKGEHQND